LTCYYGTLEAGDGINVRGGAHSIQVLGANVVSPSEASLHLVAGSALHAFGNNLGSVAGYLANTGVQIESGVSDFNVSHNDIVGASAPIIYATPSVTPTPPVVVRGNRGLNPLGAITPAPFPGLNAPYPNLGPWDCTFIFNWGSATGTAITLIGHNGTPVALPTPTALPYLFLPVGVVLKASWATGMPTWTSSFCN
jgi:hypothetical protein